MDELTLKLGPVTEIVLSRPEKQNAMTASMGKQLEAAVKTINASGAARVVLLRGAGRAFCAGGDFALLGRNAEAYPEQNRQRMLEFYRSYLSVLDLDAPSVAVVQGAAIGAGLCLAMACDLRIAAHEAKLGANFVRVGLHPGMGCSVLLPRLVGVGRAADLMLTGRVLQGIEAERIGLVSRAVPRAELESVVQATVEQLMAAAPVALAQTKSSTQGTLKSELDAALEREALMQAVDFATADLKEAVRAFGVGEKPSFVGD